MSTVIKMVERSNQTIEQILIIFTLFAVLVLIISIVSFIFTANAGTTAWGMIALFLILMMAIVIIIGTRVNIHKFSIIADRQRTHAEQLLDYRLAKGEITPEEYSRLKEILKR